jgi:hypothetical protein
MTKPVCSPDNHHSALGYSSFIDHFVRQGNKEGIKEKSINKFFFQGIFIDGLPLNKNDFSNLKPTSAQIMILV